MALFNSLDWARIAVTKLSVESKSPFRELSQLTIWNMEATIFFIFQNCLLHNQEIHNKVKSVMIYKSYIRQITCEL